MNCIKFAYQYPFFAIPLLRMNVIEDYDCPTASVNGKELRYNPSFVNELPERQQFGLIAHEVLHVVLLHHLRRRRRDVESWNAACDYAINLLLLDMGLELPPGGLIDWRFKGVTSNKIYEIITKKEEDSDDDGDSDGDDNEEEDGGDGVKQPWGDLQDYPGEAPIEEEATMKEVLAQSLQAAKMAGKGISESLFREIKSIIHPKKNAGDALRTILSDIYISSDYSWSKRNLRYGASDFIVPGVLNERILNTVIAIDTSGSIGEDELNTITQVVDDLRIESKGSAHVIYCDDEIRGEDFYETDETISLRLLGGGCTSFLPVFNKVKDCQVLVYITDGYCHEKLIEPDYPVVWVIFGENPYFKPGFGEIINI